MNLRRLAMLSLPALLGPLACFAPNQPVEDETEGSGGTESGGSSSTAAATVTGTPTQTGPTSGPGSSTDPTDGPTSAPTTEDESSTGIGEDAPPVFESFTVNGSTRPTQVDASGFVVIEADVSDDVGVARVEFLVDDMVVATDEEAPFTAEHLVTSVDSGVGDYRARAFDSAGQSAVSEEVSLGVNIPGGEQLVIRRDIFEMTSGFGINHGGLALDDNGGVYLFGTRPGNTGHVLKYNASLSQLWDSDQPAPLGAGAVAPSGSAELVLCRRLDIGSPPHAWEYAHLDRRSGAQVSTASHPISLAPGEQTLGARFAENGSGDVYATRAPDSLTLRDPELSGERWTLPIGGSASVQIIDLDVIGTDDVVLSVISGDGTECATGANKCLVRVRADGTVAWTTGLESTTNGLPHSGVASDGTIFTALGTNSGMRLYVVGPDGDVVLETVKRPLQQRTVQGLVVDPQDNIVVAGAVGPLGDRTAWVARFDGDADVLWESELLLPDAELFDVEVSDSGRLYVMGTEDQTNAGFGTAGDAFIAEFAL